MLKKLIDIYPGESFYSYIARLYAHSGLLWNTGIAKEILARPNEYVNHNFINVLRKDFRKQLETYISFEDILMEHTLFKYYVRFLPRQKRIKAYGVALKNESNLSFKYLPIPVIRRDYYLRYCPRCVEEDRKKYGECYFHIDQQIPEVHCCSKHKLKLIDTQIKNSESYESTFIPLEIVVNRLDETPASNIEARVAEYISLLQKENLEIENENEIGRFLSSKLDDKYFAPRGQRKLLTSVVRDITNHYEGLSGFNLSRQRVMTILNGAYINTYDICLLALFENISPEELNQQRIDKENRWEIFDKKVKELKEKGLKNNEIAKIMKVNKEVIRQIVLGKYYTK